MENEIYVSCHAPSLSLLLFETVRSAHDQKGLLIGEICKEIISEKTDENEMNREQRTTIYLEHCVPVKDSDFFGTVGNVNKGKLQKYIDQYCDKIVGWYSFRRNTRVNSRTLREILTHKSLLQSLKPVRPDYFVAAFMSASVGANLSTHIYNHIFMRFDPTKGTFEPVKFKIYTMSDKIKSMNGYSVRNTFPTSKNFENIINPTEEVSSPVMSILTINKAIAEYMKLINKKLGESDKVRCDLEEEIINLRKCLSLDKLGEIKVRELEHEPEMAGIHYVRFDSSVDYNPCRKENPIKIVQLNNTSRMPEESNVLQNKSDLIELNNKYFSNTPYSKNSKMFSHNATLHMPENSGSVQSKIERNPTVTYSDFDGPITRCSGDAGDSQMLQKPAESESRENEKPVKVFEENEVADVNDLRMSKNSLERLPNVSLTTEGELRSSLEITKKCKVCQEESRLLFFKQSVKCNLFYSVIHQIKKINSNFQSLKLP